MCYVRMFLDNTSVALWQQEAGMTSLRLFPDKNGEPRVRAHFINYTKREKKGSWARHGAFYLTWPSNEVRLEWVLFRLCLGFVVQVSGDDDHAFQLSFGIPGIGQFYFDVRKADWLLWLTGTKWYKGQPIVDWDRKIGFRFFDKALVLYPWVNPNHYPTHGRDIHFIRPDNILFGRQKYKKYNERSFNVGLAMPEGTYPAKVTLYTSEWKRPRWPWWPMTRRVNRADIDVENGVPIPGKGDNGWDMDDDAIFSMTCMSETVDEALEKIRKSTLGDRERRAGKGWVPDVGWPAHLEAGT